MECIFAESRVKTIYLYVLHPRLGVMIMSCITFNGVSTLWFVVDCNINANKYEEILEDNLWPVIAQHFPNKQPMSCEVQLA